MLKKFDLGKIKEADLCDFKEIAQAFKEYLTEAADVTEEYNTKTASLAQGG